MSPKYKKLKNLIYLQKINKALKERKGFKEILNKNC